MILALYGAGAMGREFKYMADASGNWEEIVFIDDNTRVITGRYMLCLKSYQESHKWTCIDEALSKIN